MIHNQFSVMVKLDSNLLLELRDLKQWKRLTCGIPEIYEFKNSKKDNFCFGDVMK